MNGLTTQSLVGEGWGEGEHTMATPTSILPAYSAEVASGYVGRASKGGGKILDTFQIILTNTNALNKWTSPPPIPPPLRGRDGWGVQRFIAFVLEFYLLEFWPLFGYWLLGFGA